MTKFYLGLFTIIILLTGALYYNFVGAPDISLPGDNPQTSTASDTTDTTAIPQSGVGTTPPKPGVTSPPKPGAASGRVLFAVTDAAAPFGSIKSIFLTINQLSVHSRAGGWVDVPVGAKTYDLLKLRNEGAVELLVDANLAVDTSYTNSRAYDQIRLNIGKVSVVLNTGETKEVKLPSGEIKIIGGYTAKKGAISMVIFDFLADQSLHTTLDGQYIFAPVLRFQSQTDNVINIEANQRIKYGGGVNSVKVSVGMNENGEVKNNFALNPNLQIEVLSNGVLKLLNPGESDTGFKIGALQAIQIAVNNGAISSALSLRILAENNQTYWSISGFKGGRIVVVKVNVETGYVVGN